MTWHPAPDPNAEHSKRLGEAIDRFLDRRGRRGVSILAKVAEVWESTVGTQVATHVRPTSIANDTLYVDVDEAGWATEVSFLAARILSGLEERLGQRVATFIKPRVRGRSGVE